MATDYSDELLEEMGKLQEQLDHSNAWDLDSQLEQAMDALRCPPPDADVSVLSGGERRRVALCRLLLQQPDLLLLDEPTNHLDAESVLWLEQHLQQYHDPVVGVIGPHGVGKTTLFKIIIGEEQPDAGSIKVGETVQIAYVDQSRDRIASDKNVWEAISDGESFIRAGRTEIPSRAYVAAFGFK